MTADRGTGVGTGLKSHLCEMEWFEGGQPPLDSSLPLPSLAHPSKVAEELA